MRPESMEVYQVISEEQRRRAAELAEKLREAEAKIPPVAFTLPQVRPHLKTGREVVAFLEEIANGKS